MVKQAQDELDASALRSSSSTPKSNLTPNSCSDNKNPVLINAIEQWLSQQLSQFHGELPDISQQSLALHLHLSERTLRRQLADSSSSFQQLLERVRKRLAQEYLADQQLTLWDVATRLGYRQLTSFNSAYKRWTGQTPAAARKQIQQAQLAQQA